jgi:hypothetical protein
VPPYTEFSLVSTLSFYKRFDFLFYQFNYSTRKSSEQLIEFFFLPERELPDSFYSSTEQELSFELPNFSKYRVKMDGAGMWVHMVLAIIRENPNPRATVPRPLRETMAIRDHINHEPALPTAQVVTAQQQSHSRQRYSKVVSEAYERFYTGMMTLCAER